MLNQPDEHSQIDSPELTKLEEAEIKDRALRDSTPDLITGEIPLQTEFIKHIEAGKPASKEVLQFAGMIASENLKHKKI